MPVLLVRAHPGHEPARALLPGVLVCEAHRDADPAALLSDAAWARIVEAFLAVGLAAPVRQLTELDYQPIH